MNPRVPTFEEFLANQGPQIAVFDFVVNLLLTAALSFLLAWIYKRYGKALSNRGLFARNFVPIAMTTMLIITVVKSSLALSLGLVGALSIVRFRAAIKEPEELAFLFLCIAVGLGFGADQRLITILAFFVIVGVLVLRSLGKGRPEGENLHLTIASRGEQRVDLDAVIGVLREHTSSVSLRRFDENREFVEATFSVSFDGFEKLRAAKEGLRRLGDGLEISFLDSRPAG